LDEFVAERKEMNDSAAHPFSSPSYSFNISLASDRHQLGKI
jgi:hypothetical protein